MTSKLITVKAHNCTQHTTPRVGTVYTDSITQQTGTVVSLTETGFDWGKDHDKHTYTHYDVELLINDSFAKTMKRNTNKIAFAEYIGKDCPVKVSYADKESFKEVFKGKAVWNKEMKTWCIARLSLLDLEDDSLQVIPVFKSIYFHAKNSSVPF